MLKVAWDMQAVTGPRPTGLGVSVRLLLDAVEEYDSSIEVIPLRPNEEDKPLKGVPDRLGWEQRRLPRMAAAAKRDGARVLYCPALCPPYRSPLPAVVHVHDLIQLRYAQQFSGFAGWYWKKLMPACWKRCRLITVSNASVRGDLEEMLGIEPQRVHIVPYYPDPQLAAEAEALRAEGASSAENSTQPLFVILATHEPRKNIALAIRALVSLKSRGLIARLVCIGGRTSHTEELQALAAEKGVAEQVDFPGYLERSETVKLLLQSTGLLAVSKYEGYGMPPQEAQSIGVPVILSDIPCHRAIYADAAKLAALPEELRITPAFVGTDDAESLSSEMQRLINDASYRAKLAQAGVAYSRLFTPEATASALEAALTKAAD